MEKNVQGWENEWLECPNNVSNHFKSKEYRNNKDRFVEDEIFDSEEISSGNDDSGTDRDDHNEVIDTCLLVLNK